VKEMLNAIVAVFVVVAIFSVVASVFTLYVWCIDRHQVAAWKATLRLRRATANAPDA
jgi:hypothetical protein